jgi:hypothetical protein
MSLPSEVRINSLFGIVANRASIVENQASFVRVFRELKAHIFQNAGHPFRVGFIHLASESSDVIAAGFNGHGQ